jgi:deazaflavin-dependent oxidoreductase (nitroreductase family)
MVRKLEMDQLTSRRYSALHTSIQVIASTRFGSWLLPKIHHHIDRYLLKLTNNQTNLTSILTGLPVVILKAKGARSGKLRTTPLLCIADGSGSDKFALIASNYGGENHPSWYYNLKAHPRASCSINGQEGDCIAHEAEGEEYAKYWQAAMETYVGFSKYQERASDRHIPIMIMEPIQ